MGIQKRLLEVLKSDKTNALTTVAIAGISVKYPIAAAFLTAAHEVAGLADEMRIDAVVKGLSTELDQEEQINTLYYYVEKSEGNAFYVANTLRKALLADSQIACTIMRKCLRVMQSMEVLTIRMTISFSMHWRLQRMRIFVCL